MADVPSVGWLSISQVGQRQIAGFSLDPAIPLPVELAAGQEAGEAAVSWEAIISGTLKVLAADPSLPNADYYRQFVLALRPDIRAEFTGAGIMTARNGKHELAIEIFRALEGLFPDDAVTAMNLALVHDERSRALERAERTEEAEQERDRAFEAYKRALAADSSEPAIHFNVAQFYLHQRSFDKAREHLEAFARLSDDAGRIRDARRLIAEIDAQGLADGLFHRAYDCIRMGREEEGIDLVRRFLVERPRVWHAWFLLGWGCRRLGRWEEGRQAFAEALSLGGGGADALNELAICEMELGDLEASEQTLRRALAEEPENVKIISNLGIVAHRHGRREEALGFFRTACELDPADPVAARWLEQLERQPS